MDVYSLNMVEKGRYQKPKSFAKEGERNVICHVFPNGDVGIEGQLTDYSVLWYSTTKVTDTETNAAVFKVILDTAKERNSEWHCSTLSLILQGCHIPYHKVEDAKEYSFEIKRNSIIKDYLLNYAESKPGCNRVIEYGDDEAGACKELADRLLRCYEIDSAKCKSDALNSTLKLKLLQYERELLEVSAETEPSRVISGYSKLSAKLKEINALDYLKLSSDESLLSAYKSVYQSSRSLYNKYMSLVR